jgi:hypothetical protein
VPANPAKTVLVSGGSRVVCREARSLGAVDLSDAPFVDNDLNGAEAKSSDALANEFQPGRRQRIFRRKNGLSFRLH